MAGSELGVLIHGAGWVSGEHIKAFAANPRTRVVAVSSRRIETARRKIAEAGLEGAAAYDDLDRALAHPGVDIVSICTPQHLHAENAVRAARAGKHLVIEKPAANTSEELRAMRDAVREARVRTVVSFVLRWNPLFRTIKALMADGALGKVYAVEADYQSFIGSWWSGWEEGRKLSTARSAMHLSGCHALDTVRWFAGGGAERAARVIEVFAWRGGWRKGQTREFNYYTNAWSEGKAPLEFDGLEMLLLKFEGGVVGKVSVNLDAVMPYTFPIEIFGDRGTVKDNRLWSHKFPGQKGWIEIPAVCPDTSDVTHHPFQAQMDHFVECILAGRESHANLEDAANTHEVIFALEKCYETGRPVQIHPES